jgi:leucine dehydrogenase
MGLELLETVESYKPIIHSFKQASDFQFELIPVDGYEFVVKVTNKKTNLKAIIAIHSTALGPTLGGIRIQPYASFEAALDDVLRLSKGMTYKSAIADVGLGGGKSVIIADPKTDKTEMLLHSFGEAVSYLKGMYICAEDVGSTLEDVKIIRKKTQYVTGLPHKKSSGDPGRYTAWGTYRGIQAVLKKTTGFDSVEGKTIAVQGLGNVGGYLAEYLFWGGANLIVSDLDEKKLQECAHKYRAKVVKPDQILTVECDVFAPCAMGGILNEKTIPQLRCKAVAGSANNQLLQDEHANLMMIRDILYAPDYVVNAGGLLNVASEIEEEGYNPKIPRDKAHQIYDALLGIFAIAEKNHISTHAAANSLAEYRIKYGIGRRIKAPVFHHSAE